MSVGGEVAAKKKAMWLYPKVLGFSPSERWGHSACYSNGSVYVFGGCCGGLHFSDVLVLDLNTMAWNTLVTVGHGPGPRDSHSAVLVGHDRMIVFGGTNGGKKVNDLHVLDLGSKEWTQPECKGQPPAPRESHSATLVGDENLVIFGGSGEGEGNYLNDLYILNLKTLRWTSPEVKGNVPIPRDSHIAVAIGSKMFVYGGDSGDRYHGDVDMFDIDTLTWTKLVVQGSWPGVRAGHATACIGTKVYVIGGVGDKHYFNDVWVLDVSACSWTQLEIHGQQPQGRFSHSAIVANSDIAIFGGCGEDERPLNELLILQLGSEHPNGRYNISLCKILGNHLNRGKRRFQTEDAGNHQKAMPLTNNLVPRNGAHDPGLKQCLGFTSDTLHPKRRRTSNSKVWEFESEQEEHSLSLSQNSSPSQSDQEQATVKNATDSIMGAHGFPFFKHRHKNHSSYESKTAAINKKDPQNMFSRTSQDHQISAKGRPKLLNPKEFVHSAQRSMLEPQIPTTVPKAPEAVPFLNMIGAEIRGMVDGVFDSGFLMTTMLDGKLFRGVLFAPGPGIVPKAPLPQASAPTSHPAVAQPQSNTSHSSPTSFWRSQQAVLGSMPESSQAQGPQPSPVVVRDAAASQDKGATSLRSDLQGVVLTLGGPGTGGQDK